MKNTIFSASNDADEIRENWIYSRRQELFNNCKENNADFIFVTPNDMKGKFAAVAFMKTDKFSSLISNWSIPHKANVVKYIKTNIGIYNALVVIIKDDGTFSFHNLISD